MADKQLKIITAWDEFEGFKIIYRKNGERKEEKITNFEWYFCINASDMDKIDKEVVRNYHRLGEVSALKRMTPDDKYIRVYCKSSKASENFRKYLVDNGCTLYESDLSLHRRYMIDNNLEIETDLKVLYFDIETDDRGNGIEIGRDTILSWAGYNSDGQKFFFSGKEQDVLGNFLEVLHDHDVFTGWNSENFDLPYIKARLSYYGSTYEKQRGFQRHTHIDMMKRCIKLYAYDMDKIGLNGFSLNEVSRVFLGEQKVKFEGGIYQLMTENFEKFKEYNLRDAELLYMLDKKLDITKLMITECEVTGTLLNKFFVGELLDNYMLRKSKLIGRYLPSRPTFNEKQFNDTQEIIGGYVKEPKTGLYDHVRVFDFKALYASIMVGFNIGEDVLNKTISFEGDKAFDIFVGPDRKIEQIEFKEWNDFLISEKKRLDPEDKHIQTANNNYFRREDKSFISGLVNELIVLRQKYKKDLAKAPVGSGEYGSLKAMQAVFKELANSMFGVTGDKTSRYFNKNVAQSITLTGQYLNKTTSQIIRGLGYDVIYGDTDSIFSPIPKDIDGEEFVGEVNRILKQFLQTRFTLPDYIIKLEYEKKYKKMIMIDKKKYTGIMDFLNEQDVDVRFSKGTEDIKRNTTELARRNIIELIEMITRYERDVPSIKAWLDNLKTFVFTDQNIPPEDLTMSVKISKSIDEYKSKSAHVKLAESLIAKQKMLDVGAAGRSSWNKIEYIIKTTTPAQEAISPEDFDGIWDRTYYWDVQIFAPMLRILQAAFPTEQWDDYLESLKAKRLKKEALLVARAERDRLQLEKKAEREKKKKEREEERAKKQAEREVRKQLRTKTLL